MQVEKKLKGFIISPYFFSSTRGSHFPQWVTFECVTVFYMFTVWVFHCFGTSARILVSEKGRSHCHQNYITH